MPVEIFCCYARKDQQFLEELEAHLKPLQDGGLITLWADTDIGAGTEWEEEIHRHLNTAQIILLLISPAFMASDYCYSIELKRAIERHERKEAKVIPVILRPVLWQGVLGTLQALPKDGLPVTDIGWHTIDNAFFSITQGLLQVIKSFNAEEEEHHRKLQKQERSQKVEEIRRSAQETEQVPRIEQEHNRQTQQKNSPSTLQKPLVKAPSLNRTT